MRLSQSALHALGNLLRSTSATNDFADLMNSPTALRSNSSVTKRSATPARSHSSTRMARCVCLRERRSRAWQITALDGPVADRLAEREQHRTLPKFRPGEDLPVNVGLTDRVPALRAGDGHGTRLLGGQAGVILVPWLLTRQ